MKVTCDECKQQFSPKLVEKRQDDGSVIQDFTCPACKHRYPIAHITKKGIEIRDKMEQLRKVKQGHGALFQMHQRNYLREFTDLTRTPVDG